MLAVDVIQNDGDNDEYTIVTKSGQRIKPSELILHSTVHIESVGKSVDKSKTWEKLLTYYRDLVASGQLEQ
jgi:hypothetical protein